MKSWYACFFLLCCWPHFVYSDEDLHKRVSRIEDLLADVNETLYDMNVNSQFGFLTML